MKAFEKLLDKYIEIACNTPILSLVFRSLNRNNLRTCLKYTIIGGALTAAISLITKAPASVFFVLCISLFLINISLASIYSERFRPLVLNQNNSFENTVYILYFFIYTGVAGLLLSGFMLFGWLQKII
jgi:hypothetical protein